MLLWTHNEYFLQIFIEHSVYGKLNNIAITNFNLKGTLTFADGSPDQVLSDVCPFFSLFVCIFFIPCGTKPRTTNANLVVFCSCFCATRVFFFVLTFCCASSDLEIFGQ